MDIHNMKYWAEMNAEERDHFLELIEHVMSKVSDETDWHELEQVDAYCHAVQNRIGRSEEENLEQSALFEEDLDERFYKHCNRGFRRGMREAACARHWLCRAE